MAKYGNWFENAKKVLGGLQFKDSNAADLVVTYSTVSQDLSDTDVGSVYVELDGSTVAAGLINWTPTVGKQYVIWCSDSTNDCGIVLSSGITYDGTNDTATFADADDTLIVYCVSATRLVIVENIGGVTFS
jgi:hypothetical protein